MSAAGVFAVWLLLGVIGAGATTWLVVRVWRRREQASLAAKLVTSVIAAAALCGAFGTLFGLVKAFGAIGGESVDPSQKARLLAEGISEAMNWTALSLAIWIPSVIVALLLTRASRSPR